PHPRDTIMLSASASFGQFRPIRTVLCVRLLLAVGLVAGLFPGITARGGTNGRVRAKRVVPPRRTGQGKRGGSASTPAATHAPAASPAPALASAPSVAPPTSPSTSPVIPSIE